QPHAAANRPPRRRPHDTSPLIESCQQARERDSVLASLNLLLSSTQQVVFPPFKGHRCNP
ncbi:MAG: hypothetical protein ACPIOQ_76620, partial [Promethearchaeia archaeon]